MCVSLFSFVLVRVMPRRAFILLAVCVLGVPSSASSLSFNNTLIHLLPDGPSLAQNNQTQRTLCESPSQSGKIITHWLPPIQSLDPLALCLSVEVWSFCFLPWLSCLSFSSFASRSSFLAHLAIRYDTIRSILLVLLFFFAIFIFFFFLLLHPRLSLSPPIFLSFTSFTSFTSCNCGVLVWCKSVCFPSRSPSALSHLSCFYPDFFFPSLHPLLPSSLILRRHRFCSVTILDKTPITYPAQRNISFTFY